MLFEGSRIIEVGTNIAVPKDSEVINAEGQTLLPGLIDAHVHVLYPQSLKQMLVFGVTSVVDMNMMVKTMKDVKKILLLLLDQLPCSSATSKKELPRVSVQDGLYPPTPSGRKIQGRIS